MSTLEVGDVWYFLKGAAHVVQGLDDENEYLLAFDHGDFDRIGTTFMVDDWLAHTPADVVAKNFGVDPAVFEKLPATDPYMLNATVSTRNVTGSNDLLEGNSSYVYYAKDHATEPVPGQGGTFRKVDSSTFPIATTIAAAFVTLEPKGLRELHWHPNVRFRQSEKRLSALTEARLRNGYTSTKAQLERASSSVMLPPGHLSSALAIQLCFQTTPVRVLRWTA